MNRQAEQQQVARSAGCDKRSKTTKPKESGTLVPDSFGLII